MPPLSFLIKPASSACNLRCKYCFYHSIAENRTVANTGCLSLVLLEKLIREAFDNAQGSCTFAFQGGEPTLVGLNYYRELIKLQDKYKRSGIHVNNTIQTNGMLIDDEWASFLKENNFLVGLSLDGPAAVHDANRVHSSGKGSFNRVMKTVALFNRYAVEYNILSVITGKNSDNIEKIYNFLKKNRFKHLQFIVCLEPLGQERGTSVYHLSIKRYETFLCNLFDLYMRDLLAGDYISIRQFDNYVRMANAENPEACNMCGRCSIQLIVEGDGGIYPCDFYVYDEYRLGTIGADSLKDCIGSKTAQTFIQDSMYIPDDCKVCPHYALCRNGCRRDRTSTGKNYYCEAYKGFFDKKEKEICSIALLLQSNML